MNSSCVDDSVLIPDEPAPFKYASLTILIWSEFGIAILVVLLKWNRKLGVAQ